MTSVIDFSQHFVGAGMVWGNARGLDGFAYARYVSKTDK